MKYEIRREFLFAEVIPQLSNTKIIQLKDPAVSETSSCTAFAQPQCLISPIFINKQPGDRSAHWLVSIRALSDCCGSLSTATSPDPAAFPQ